METTRLWTRRYWTLSIGVYGMLLGLDCTGQGTCPPNGVIVPGYTCVGDDLQCPYDMPVTACDGTRITEPTSCSCTDGTWECPSATSTCPDEGNGSAGANSGARPSAAGAESAARDTTGTSGIGDG